MLRVRVTSLEEVP
jgi:hypothetical protein